MATKKSTKPTGLSVARSGNTFTLSWKVGAKNYNGGQTLQYRVNDGATQQQKWSNGSTTSFSFTTAGVYKVWFRVHGKRKNETKTTFSWSDWSEFTWSAVAPGAPTIEFSLDASNQGTFSWTHSHSDTDNAPFDHVEACTCTVTHNGWPTEAEWGSLFSVSESGSQTISESGSGNFIRWYRVRAVGVAGASAWANSSHSYGTPEPATIDYAKSETYGSTSRITAQWRIGYDPMHPLDNMTVQYAIDTPTDTSLTAPASGWSDAISVVPNGVNGNASAVVNVEDVVGADQVMWIRVMSTHDENNNYSGAVVAQKGALRAPDINATPNATTGDVAITITENTDCEVACTAIFYRSGDDPSNDRIIAIFPNGTTSQTVNVPAVVGAETTCFGAYAFVGTYSGTIITSRQMWSTANIDSDIVALAPATITASAGPIDGAVRIGWEWTWSSATIAELSWADNEYAWQSTEQPSTYRVEDMYSNTWLVLGLETGMRWWFRVRLINGSEDDEVIGPWSELVSYDLSSVPDKPVLNLSKTVINEGGTFTAKWAYNSTSENDTQAYAEICEVTYSGNTPVYGDLVAYTDTSQSIEIDQTWTTGTTHYLAVRVTSSTGTQSEWSEPVGIYVAAPVSISATTSLTNSVLTAMPLTATVTGAGTAGTTTLSIIRAEDYHLLRPDDKDFDGYAGETIVTHTQTGEDAITINVADLVGNLDDGAKYTLIVSVIDTYGQTASLEYPFTVDWTHKADTPSVTVEIDKYQRIAKITPIAPVGYAAGDTCDIYRITADQPELIYKGATFGTTYVDPYPGFGESCGHRLVTITTNGDYTTDTGLGWYDADSDDGDILTDEQMVIDVDGAQIELPYNLSLSNKWNKDFKRTSYLGGSVQGDWNPAVTRDLSANTVLIRGDDLDRQLAMRDLAGFAGVAHIRTPDGSSLTADVLIDESQSFDTKKVSYTLTVKAIDPQDPVGVTLEDWQDEHPVGE